MEYKHDWEPTDSQGYSMDCMTCGQSISFHDDDNWDKHIDATCPESTKTKQ